MEGRIPISCQNLCPIWDGSDKRKSQCKYRHYEDDDAGEKRGVCLYRANTAPKAPNIQKKRVRASIKRAKDLGKIIGDNCY